jgi:hypothetical protein
VGSDSRNKIIDAFIDPDGNAWNKCGSRGCNDETMTPTAEADSGSGGTSDAVKRAT